MKLNAPSFFGLILGAGLTGAFVLIALIAAVWTPYDVAAIDVNARFLSPSGSHWLGTDHLGRDVLSMLMAGAGNALIVALVSTLGALVAGGLLGLIAATFGGPVDAVVMRVNDVVFAFPALVLAILLGAVMGAGVVNAAIAIALFNLPVFARLSRSEALKHTPQAYVLAARLAGKGRLRIAFEHLLPQMRGVLLAQALIQMSFSVAAESGLAYVGLGAVPPSVSWGRMIYDAQTLITEAPLLILSPCVMIVLFVFGLNRLAQAVGGDRS